jgi:hypothetical protein
VNGKIYVIGGNRYLGSSGLSVVEVYDPETDTWIEGTEMLNPRTETCATVVNGRIYLIGGSVKSQGSPLSVVEEYTPSTIPVFDFNGDEIVDGADMSIMVDYWGTDEPLYDIAPPPFGDGVVDVHDLILLSEHLFEEIFPPELLAYWKLDEIEGIIANNSIGDTNGYLIGEPVWQPTEGKRDSALELDGIGDYIISDYVLNPTKGQFSVFAWIKGGATGQVIISQADGNGSDETWLGLTTSDGCLMTGLVPPPVGRFIPQPLESESVVTDGQWHHVGFVWDGAYRCLYVDGIEVAIDTQALAPLKSSNGAMFIGTSKMLDAGTFFSGLIDEVRIYNIALSADRIATLAQ